jgi:ABC-type sulfate transport system permease component
LLSLATIVCAYVAAVVNGIVILNLALMFTLTVWAGWNVLGGIIGVVIALPVVGILEKAQVKRVKIE